MLRAGRPLVLLVNPPHLVLLRLSQPQVYLGNLNKALLSQMLSVLRRQRPPLVLEPLVNRQLPKLPNNQRAYSVAARLANLNSSNSPASRRTRLEHSDNPPSKINSHPVVYLEEEQRRLVSQNRREQGLEHSEVERLVPLRPPQTRLASRSNSNNNNQLPLGYLDKLSLLHRTLLAPLVSLSFYV